MWLKNAKMCAVPVQHRSRWQSAYRAANSWAIVTDGCELLPEEACQSGAWLDSWLQHDFSAEQSRATPRQLKAKYVQANVVSTCTLSEQLTLLSQRFQGNQVQPVCTLSLLGQMLFREAELRAVGDSD